ncbi:MAG: acetamidase/formamidase family protein, partial [Thermoguttaceae bacterium]|nr:acetamidase/formamidase family protein [Thermoguttaceae bacterium]
MARRLRLPRLVVSFELAEVDFGVFLAFFRFFLFIAAEFAFGRRNRFVAGLVLAPPAVRAGEIGVGVARVEGAEVGDAIVIEIRSVEVTSMVTASGNDQAIDGRFVGDPFVAVKCPVCGELYPETYLEGIGQDAVKCAKCGAPVAPFRVSNGYTIAFDQPHAVGVTLDQPAAEKAARDAHNYMQIPDNSMQNPISAFAVH